MSSHNTDHEEHDHHLTPFSVFYKTFAALIFLTLTTVATAQYDLSEFGLGHYGNIGLAMFIATIKACLVGTFFMQLKYDKAENRVTLIGSVVFVFIFIGITASDVFFRAVVVPITIEKPLEIYGGMDEDENVLRIASPDLKKQGETLFKNTCAVCHGPEGKGDGPGGKTNPPARDFTAGIWKFGGTPTQVFHTITNGSPGTSMAGWSSLSKTERYALVHYVRSLSPKTPEDTPETLTKAGISGESKKVATVKKVQKLPVDFVMGRMEVPDQVIVPSDRKEGFAPGQGTYASSCVSCHGVQGVGKEFRALGVNPAAVYITKPLAGSKSPWVNSKAEFIKVVSEGMPGFGKPGISGFSPVEWDLLYSYVKNLGVN